MQRDGVERFTIRVRHGSGPRPWYATITHGIAIVGEAGGSVYASRRPSQTLKKAVKAIAAMAASSHPDRIEITVDWDDRSLRRGGSA